MVYSTPCQTCLMELFAIMFPKISILDVGHGRKYASDKQFYNHLVQVANSTTRFIYYNFHPQVYYGDGIILALAQYFNICKNVFIILCT